MIYILKKKTHIHFWRLFVLKCKYMRYT